MPDFDTNFAFTAGKLTIILDGGAGSSGKGKLGSFVCEHGQNWQFACNTFMPQAGHWVRLDDGREFLYQTLNSCAYLSDRYEKLYIAPGAAIEPALLFRELEENGIPRQKVGISPLTAIVQDIDKEYEKGLRAFDGRPMEEIQPGGPLAASGSTAHGCGATRARRVLRRDEARYAHHVPELREFLCDVPGEIMDRLDRGQAGLFEVAQGFQLSFLLPRFFPSTTSRNCTVAAGLDDLMVPPFYAGNVIINFRTFPIRIHSSKYVDRASGDHLTWEEKQAAHPDSYSVVEGTSGGHYHDQREVTWDDVVKISGSQEPFSEMTSVTGLPRRVFTFSAMNVAEAVRHNRTHGETFLSLNFADYVDYELSGRRMRVPEPTAAAVGPKLAGWLQENLDDRRLRFIGTGPKTDDMIQIG
jgi:adenylosuccinate synthase